MLIYMLIECEC